MPRYTLPDWVLRKAGANPFIAAAGKLVSGTALAQAITFLALPVITRLYSPQDLAILAAFLALHNIAVVVVCARLEIAIPLAQDDGDATRLTVLSTASTALFALLLAAATLLAGDAITAALAVPQLAPVIALLPLSVFAAGLYAATQYYATRQRQFGAIASTRVVQALAGSGTQIGLGLLRAGPIGLLIGQILLAGAGSMRLGALWLRTGHLRTTDLSRAKLLDTLARFRRFPLFSTPEAFANRASAEVPILLIAAYAIGPEAGFLLLAVKAMGAPLSLLGNAAGQVFMSDARDAHGRGELGTLTARVLVLLGKLTIGPTVFAAMIAPPAFALIFGAEWVRAGEIVVWMVGWSVLKCLTSPISSILHVQMRQRAMMALQLAGAIIRIGATLYAAFYRPDVIVEAYVLASAAFYLLCLVVYGAAAGVRLAPVMRALPMIGMICAAWVALGLAVRFGLAAIV